MTLELDRSTVDAADARLADLFPERKVRQRSPRKPKENASQKKRESIVALVESGWRIADALAELGVSLKSHEYYRRTDASYRARIDVARTLHNKSLDRGWTGDSISFAQTFFPKKFASPGFHHAIHRTLMEAQAGTITLINVFPAAGKTAIIEDFICQTLAVDPNHRFVVASKGQNHAKKVLETVKDRMTNINNFPDYIGRFGPFFVEGMDRHGKPWTRDHIKVFKNDGSQRDNSLQAMGWKSQILGSRVDTIILDDIQTGDNLNLVDEMIDKFRQEFYSRLEDGRIIIIGNRIAPGDFYEKLLELDIVEPANHHDYPAVDYQGESLWPEKWPVEDRVDEQGRVTWQGLKTRRRIMGEKIWWTTYQQKPQLASNATFDEEMVERSKAWSRKVGAITPGKPTLLSIDPGLDPGATAITCMQYDSSTIDVIDGEKHNDFTQQEQILDLIESYAIRYHPQHVVIETVAFQRALERDDRLQALGRRYGFLTHPHNTGRNKQDPIMGVAAMATSFLRDEITFPYEAGPGSVSASRMDPILAELRAWRPNIPTKLLTQDFVMSLWFGWRYLIEARHAMGVAPDAWRRPSHLPWEKASTPWVSSQWSRKAVSA